MNFATILGVLAALLVAVSVEGERLKRAIVGQKWPTNNIAYRFDQNFTSETARVTIRSVLKEMEKLLEVDGQKCLQFNEIDKHQDEGYILFDNKNDQDDYDDEGCNGQVGYWKNKTSILNLSNERLEPYSIMHEVLHRLGFDHEQSRHDKYHHVNVNWENIRSDGWRNFYVNGYSNSNKSQDVPYDFFSISHYASNMFAINSDETTVESSFPSLMNKNRIDKAKTLSPLDILQIQRFYKCRETPAPTIRGSVEISTDKQWQLNFKFLSEVTATKDFNMSIAKQYLERTLETCGKTHFWPLKYPLIDNYDEHYRRVCVEKRALGESCQFSIECESGDCHKEKCAMSSQFKALRLANYYAGPLNVSSPAKCYAECLMDGPCEAASFHNSTKSCYLLTKKDFTAYRDPEYVSMGLTDDVMLDKFAFIHEGYRVLNPYSNVTDATSALQCFQACVKDPSCKSSSFSSSDGNRCLLFDENETEQQRDSSYVTYRTFLLF